MEEELSEEKVAQLCKFMRIIDLFDKHKAEIDPFTEIVDSVQEIRELVDKIMSLLSDEQKDYVLEVHKIQTEYLEAQLKKDKIEEAKKKK